MNARQSRPQPDRPWWAHRAYRTLRQAIARGDFELVVRLRLEEPSKRFAVSDLARERTLVRCEAQRNWINHGTDRWEAQPLGAAHALGLVERPWATSPVPWTTNGRPATVNFI